MEVITFSCPSSVQVLASICTRSGSSLTSPTWSLALIPAPKVHAAATGLSCVPLPQVTIVVLGNKCDLQEQRRVDPDVAQHWAKSEKVKLWEVSVADRRSLLEPFVYLASKMTQPQSKSAFPLSRKNKGSGSLDG